MNPFHMFLPQASNLAPRIDALFWTLAALCALVALGVFFAIVYFCIRYRRGSRADRSGGPSQSLDVELTWTIAPFLVFLGVFGWSLVLFAHSRTPPADAQTLYIVAKQWMWKVQHPGGQREINTMHVPLGKPIRLTMTSQDVIHSFYVPAFRVKQDVLPGRYTQLWFTATKPGTFPLFCAEYCGLDHSRMGGVVVVNTAADYAAWLAAHDSGAGLAAQGATVFRRAGCSGCHGENASVHAPDLQGIYGRPVQLSDGSSVLADERYLRDSILLPKAQIVAGYAPIMPSYAGQLSEEEVIALIHYLKSLSEAQ
ncbi:MAG: cytochrome c oxidase subunit II [Sinobacteraceae bacterium]|nr:cytochrome c oxidase subunit II [Nevskiaceae bacterium]MBV8855015.1 cytochrome c oxidase subunit II [Nevskiaceae bacterium]